MGEKKFTKFEEILKENPNIINSMCGYDKRTFLMKAVYQKRFDIFSELAKFPKDFSVLGNFTQNICILMVRGEMFDICKCWKRRRQSKTSSMEKRTTTNGNHCMLWHRRTIMTSSDGYWRKEQILMRNFLMVDALI